MPYILKMKDRVKHVFPLQSSCFFSHPPSSSSFAHSPAINQFPSRSAFEGKAEKKDERRRLSVSQKKRRICKTDKFPICRSSYCESGVVSCVS